MLTVDDVVLGCAWCDVWTDGQPLPLVPWYGWPSGRPEPPPWPCEPALQHRTVRLSERDVAALEALAGQLGTTVSDALRRALAAGVAVLENGRSDH